MENKQLKILIIRLSALGDTIHTLPLAFAIKEQFSGSEIGWLVEDKAQQFIKNNPLVDKCFVVPKKDWKNRGFSFKNIVEFFSIIKQIKQEKYDIVIDTQQLFKSAMFLPFLNIKRKLTHSDGREFSWLFANEFIKTDRKQFDLNYHVVDRNLDFARHLGCSNPKVEFVLPPVSIAAAEKVKGMFAVLDDKPTITLCPATTWENKHWKNEYWAKIIDKFADKCNIVLTGSSNDEKLIDDILQLSTSKNILNLCSKTNLMELSEVFRYSTVVISPDSGSAHIAWAVGVPSVITVFCATSANRTGPYGSNCYSIAPHLDCAPCMKKKCRLKVSKNLCTAAIKPEEIINIVNKLLQS